MTSSIQSKIDSILKARKTRLPAIEAEKAKWASLRDALDRSVGTVHAAGSAEGNESLKGLSNQIRDAVVSADEVVRKYAVLLERFSRDTVCIGIGGAARMGKSTFLQAVTGLGETQIPTSDKYFTTAIRSVIENTNQEGVAIADMHTEASFLAEVIAPMCDAVRFPAPRTFDDFVGMTFSSDNLKYDEQKSVLARLEDARQAHATYRDELTGERQRKIPLPELRPYVAYPEGGRTKAGPFLAVKNLVIRVPFPSAEVRQLRVVDLPGVGEAGRDLARVQAQGMKDECDMTLLMKRPLDTNIEWTGADDNALVAMGEANPLVQDQSKFTLVLANVDNQDPERAEGCIDSIHRNINEKRSEASRFKIIRCDASNRKNVREKTMPEILRFLGDNLSEIDAAADEAVKKEAGRSLKGIQKILDDVSRKIEDVAKDNQSDELFAEGLIRDIAKSLNAFAQKVSAQKAGVDAEWDAEVSRTAELVLKWIDEGCGYGSVEALRQAVRDEMVRKRAQPSDVINTLRVRFREQWDRTDDHLQGRIAEILDGIVESLKAPTRAFVPARPDAANDLASVRAQLKETAEKIRRTPGQKRGEDKVLAQLAAPLERLCEFDLRFRFHLEPTLVAVSDVIRANELPQYKTGDDKDAESFVDALLKQLRDSANKYHAAMKSRAAGSTGGLEKWRRQLERVVPDPLILKDLLESLEKNAATTQSFSPNRIFAAVVESATDAFVRSESSDTALRIIARNYKADLTEAPTSGIRLARQALPLVVEAKNAAAHVA
ncbi:MAG: hypothetical protein ACOX9C_01760 [Kiritimatiellia bacterium]|jgi:hypothetical protein